MNRNKFRLFAFLLGTLLLGGCIGNTVGGYIDADENIVTARQMVEFSFAPDDLALTKSSYVAPSAEKNVNSLSVFIFDGGALYYKGYTSGGSMSVPMDPGKTYDVHVLVNMGDVTSSVTSLSFLQEYRYSITSSNLSGGLPMYGSDAVTVTASTRSASIPVKRLVARYELLVSKENLSAGADLRVKSVQVRNMASSVKPCSTTYRADGVVAMGDYSSAADVTALNSGNGVYYYVAENLQGIEPGIDMPRKKIPSYSYTFVDPGKATYLEVKCTFSKGGTDSDVIYRLFLGGNSTTDFNIWRNTRYAVTLAPYDLDTDVSWWKCEPELDYTYVIAITPASQSVKTGHQTSFKAKLQKYLLGVYQSGKDEDITALANWSVKTGGAYASSDGQGWFTGMGTASGTATVTCTYDGLDAESPATLNVIGYKGMYMSPTSVIVGVGSSRTLQAFMQYDDNSTEDVSLDAATTWTPGNGNVTVDKGVVTGVALGTSTVTASYKGYSASAAVTIQNDVITYALVLSPDPLELVVGGSGSLAATLNQYRNGYLEYSSPVNPSDISWSSNNSGIASVNNGNVSGVSVGSTSIVATYSFYSASATVNVTAADYYELVISPASQTVSVGGSASYTATYNTYRGGTTTLISSVDVTGSANWSVSGNAKMTGKGVFEGSSVGSASINATYGGKSASATLTVQNVEKVLTSISVSVARPKIPVGRSTVATVTAYYSDGTSRDVTAEANISASGAASASGSTITGGSCGYATVRADFGGKSAQTSLQVVADISIYAVVSGSASAVYYDTTNGSHTAGSTVTSSASISVRIMGAGADITSSCSMVRQTSGNGDMSISGSTVTPANPKSIIPYPAAAGSYSSTTRTGTFVFTYIDDMGFEHTASATVTASYVRDNGSAMFRN